MTRRKFCSLAGAALSLGGATPVWAQSIGEGKTCRASRCRPIPTIVSDYHFHGLSLSDRDPAIQGGIDVSMDNGLFAGSRASSIANFGCSNVELDLYAGYGGSAPVLDYSVTVLGYFYPGGKRCKLSRSRSRRG